MYSPSSSSLVRKGSYKFLAAKALVHSPLSAPPKAKLPSASERAKAHNIISSSISHPMLHREPDKAVELNLGSPIGETQSTSERWLLGVLLVVRVIDASKSGGGGRKNAPLLCPPPPPTPPPPPPPPPTTAAAFLLAAESSVSFSSTRLRH
jgi:hypothetical protein